MSKMDVSSLEQALAQLKMAMDMAERERDNEVIRDGVIQRFEYSTDLSWKFIQRYLLEIAQVDQLEIPTKKDLFREGEKRGLITDAERWFAHYEHRNMTAHTYNRAHAETIFEGVPGFYGDAVKLLAELRKRG